MVNEILKTSQVGANTNKFVVITLRNSSFSIMAKTSLLVSGSPTYTLMVSNINSTNESDFRDLATTTTDIPLTESVEVSECLFQYLAIKYTSNSSTGEVQFYLRND